MDISHVKMHLWLSHNTNTYSLWMTECPFSIYESAISLRERRTYQNVSGDVFRVVGGDIENWGKSSKGNRPKQRRGR